MSKVKEINITHVVSVRRVPTGSTGYYDITYNFPLTPSTVRRLERLIRNGLEWNPHYVTVPYVNKWYGGVRLVRRA